MEKLKSSILQVGKGRYNLLTINKQWTIQMYLLMRYKN